LQEVQALQDQNRQMETKLEQSQRCLEAAHEDTELAIDLANKSVNIQGELLI
jgi:hypothetical protein